MFVDGECWDFFLVMGCQCCGQIDCFWMFGVVKVLDGFWVQWIYVDGFVVVVLVGGDGDGDVDVLVVEFFFIGG